MNKTILLYLSLLLFFTSGILIIFKLGTHLHPKQNIAERREVQLTESTTTPPGAHPDILSSASKTLQENLRHSLSILLLQIIVILVVAKIVGRLFRKLGQPHVVGEMIAGILLGPSLLGWLSPSTMAFLFPPSAIGPLRLFSEIGIILFMFTVGLGLDLQSLLRQAHSVVLVSHAGIIVPFFLGASLSLLIFRPFAPSHVSFTAFALFLGVAMSITAFPVLARILEERGLSNSRLGGIAIACAAVDDVTAWCILAVVVAIVRAGGLESALLTILLTVIYIAVMLFLIKPRASRLAISVNSGTGGNGHVVGVLIFIFASALVTESIGVHSLFGAFLAGVTLSHKPQMRLFFTDRLGVLTTSFMLPLFFAMTGLRTQIALLNDWPSWFACVGVIAVAILGKLGGGMIAARATGTSWHDSISLGILLNTRGLVELIVLNIGYDLGVLSPAIFSMMVLMAISTTMMTGPILSLLEVRRLREKALFDHADVAV